MGDSPTTTTSTQSTENIPAEAKPLANALAALGIKSLEGYGTADPGYNTGYRAELQKMAGGGYLDPSTNPALQKQLASVDTRAQETFQRALADSQSAAAQAGGLLGVKSRVAAAEAGRRVAGDAAQTKAGLEAANYNTERANQNTAQEKLYALYRQPLMDALTALSILRGTSGVANTQTTRSGGGNILSTLGQIF